VGKHPRQLGLDPLVHPPGQEAVTGQGVVDLVLEPGAVRAVGEAVGVGPAGERAAQLDVPKEDAGLGGQMAGVPPGSMVPVRDSTATRSQGGVSRSSAPGRLCQS
jgi:hypothetical protein